MADWQALAFHSVYWADQFNLRLSDVLPDALHFQLLAQPGLGPHRLVRGVALYPDVDHPCHSHQQDTVPPKLGQLAAHPHLLDHRRRRCLADGFAAGGHARVCSTPAAVLALSGHHAARLCDSDPTGEDLVYSPVWRMMAHESNGVFTLWHSVGSRTILI